MILSYVGRPICKSHGGRGRWGPAIALPPGVQKAVDIMEELV